MKFLTILYPSIFLFFLLQNNVLAYDASIGLGNLNEYIGKIQTDDKGTLNLITFNPYLKASADFIFYPQLLLTPEIGTTLPKSDDESTTKRMSFYTLLNTTYLINSWHLKIGTGIFFTRISGPGGEETLRNGNSTTAFPLPDHAVVARNFVVNVAVEYNFHDKFFAEIQTLIFNLTSKEDRAATVGINVNYHLGEF